MINLINLINNSSFEKFNYYQNEGQYVIKLENYDMINENQLTDKYAYNGTYSIYVDNINKVKLYDNFLNNHKYYFRGYFKTVNENYLPNDIYLLNGNKSSNQIGNFTNNTLNWEFKSVIIENFNNLNELIISSKNELLIDAMMLIDLTDMFGYNHEPSQNWCDENIPYFEVSHELNYKSNEIHFLNISDFVYEKHIKKYFSTSYQPTLRFIIDYIDNEYNELADTDDDKLNVQIQITKKTDSDKLESETIIKYYEDLTRVDTNIFECSNLEFDENTVSVKYDITSDNSLNNRLTKSFIIYFTKCFKTLDVELIDLFDYPSEYLRTIKGTTNSFVNAPTQINVFINGAKTSHVNFLNQDDNLSVFEKDVYLSDGNNVIEVVATDICGNSYSKKFEEYVDCIPRVTIKEQLLENFIGNDDKYLSLHVGDADLEYETKDAGNDKIVLINTDIDSHYFNLEGKKSNLYRISKENIPRIESTIIKRPLVVNFDTVEKIYDGNNDMTQEFKKLTLDDGIYVNDVHMEYSEFINTGLIKDTYERKITSELICKQYDSINEIYTIEKPNVNLNTFYINLDGFDGYSFLNENDGTAEILFNSEKINKYFDSIMLLPQGDKTILQFIYKDKEKTYMVLDKVNIKYNYSDNVSSNLAMYRPTDSLKIDFNSATISSCEVSDEIQLINFSNLAFLGDSANNYQIANYNACGKILKKTIYPYINCLDKIYDGSLIAPFEINVNKGNRGFDGLVGNDDVFIDTHYNDNRLDECHVFKSHGRSVLTFDNADVEMNKNVNVENITLEGLDIHNYKLGEVSADFKASILPRPINIVINKVRFIRSKRLWEVDYTIINDIKTDNLTLNYNTNDEFDIQVFGGIDSNNNSMHLNYSTIPNIQTLFFNYDFNNNYNFNNSIVNGTHVENTDTYFWNNDDRVAEPDTERIDITANYDVNYEGNTKLSLTENPYFESQNKEYRIYSGCKVMVTNIHLNPSNDKNKNYTLLNNTYETTIEII